jgi:hypothetical protein
MIISQDKGCDHGYRDHNSKCKEPESTKHCGPSHISSFGKITVIHGDQVNAPSTSPLRTFTLALSVWVTYWCVGLILFPVRMQGKTKQYGYLRNGEANRRLGQTLPARASEAVWRAASRNNKRERQGRIVFLIALQHSAAIVGCTESFTIIRHGMEGDRTPARIAWKPDGALHSCGLAYLQGLSDRGTGGGRLVRCSERQQETGILTWEKHAYCKRARWCSANVPNHDANWHLDRIILHDHRGTAPSEILNDKIRSPRSRIQWYRIEVRCRGTRHLSGDRG